MTNSAKKNESKLNTGISVIFIVVLLGLGLMSLVKMISATGLTVMNVLTSSGLDAATAAFDDSFKEQMFLKEELTDVASLSDRVMGRDFADNYGYYRYNGMILRQVWQEDVDNNLTREFASFADDATGLGYHGRYFFVQQDSRSDDFTLPSGVITEDASGFEMEQNKEIIDASSAEYVRIPSEYTSFYRTDIHNTKESEIDTVRYLVSVLENHGIQFNDKELLDYTDGKLYEKKVCDFLGGNGRSCGRFFAGSEEYSKYEPLFDTDITVQMYDSREVFEGTATEVLLKQNKEKFKKYPYYVTDDGYYGEAAYKIINNNLPDAPKVAVLMDSSALSGVCYLSLVCSEVTVLDPRFSVGDECARLLKEDMKDYDAFIMYFVADNPLRYSLYKAPDV